VKVVLFLTTQKTPAGGEVLFSSAETHGHLSFFFFSFGNGHPPPLSSLFFFLPPPPREGKTCAFPSTMGQRRDCPTLSPSPFFFSFSPLGGAGTSPSPPLSFLLKSKTYGKPPLGEKRKGRALLFSPPLFFPRPCTAGHRGQRFFLNGARHTHLVIVPPFFFFFFFLVPPRPRHHRKTTSRKQPTPSPPFSLFFSPSSSLSCAGVPVSAFPEGRPAVWRERQLFFFLLSPPPPFFFFFPPFSPLRGGRGRGPAKEEVGPRFDFFPPPSGTGEFTMGPVRGFSPSFPP